MDHVCRACMTTKESFTYVLFENVSAEVFSFCTSIEVHEHEEIPKTICDICYELLQKYSDFKRTCIDSQNALSVLSSNVKIPKDEMNESMDADNMFVEENCEDNKDFKLDLRDKDTNDDFPQMEEAFGEEIPIKMKPTKDKKIIGKSERKTKIQIKNIVKEKMVFGFDCETCKKKFKYKERLEAHKLEHLGQTVTKTCTACNKTFMTWSGLKRHNDSWHRAVRLDSLCCKRCGKVFRSQQTLRLHARLHEPPSGGFVCDICGKSYSTPVSLKHHLEGHNENRTRNFSCEHCGKKFFTKPMLKTHIRRLHTGKRYICQICNYPFTDKYNLAKHLLIHQGIKGHKCDICEKCYSTRSALVIHMRIHSGERPFACTYCGKSFTCRNRLIVHHRVHTGERPHRCSVCNQAFTQLGTMKRHMKTHNKVPLIGL